MDAVPTCYAFDLPPEYTGMRLDKALFLLADGEGLGWSRTRAAAWVRGGHVTLDGAVCADPAAALRAGARQLRVTLPPPDPSPLTPRADIPFEIVHEDDWLLVINKPAGLTVHPAAGHRDDTLVNALLAHCAGTLSGIGGVERPGIVHRLDKDTSGLMVVAKTDAAHAHLSAQLADRSLSREYLAWVWGVPDRPQGTYTGNIGRDPRHRQRMAVVPPPGGKPAVTHWRCVRTLAEGALSLWQVTLETGRTHQIRVHCAHHGHPLLADPLYGPPPGKLRARLAALPEELHAVMDTLPGQALHARRLRFIHPHTHQQLTCEAPPPPAWTELGL